MQTIRLFTPAPLCHAGVRVRWLCLQTRLHPCQSASFQFPTHYQWVRASGGRSSLQLWPLVAWEHKQKLLWDALNLIWKMLQDVLHLSDARRMNATIWIVILGCFHSLRPDTNETGGETHLYICIKILQKSRDPIMSSDGWLTLFTASAVWPQRSEQVAIGSSAGWWWWQLKKITLPRHNANGFSWINYIKMNDLAIILWDEYNITHSYFQWILSEPRLQAAAMKYAEWKQMFSSGFAQQNGWIILEMDYCNIGVFFHR